MKKLFTLTAMAFCSLAMFAGTWEKPAITADMYIPFAPGDTVYVYNTESSLFLTEGNNWGTHASVGDAGLLFTFQKYEQDGTWDGKTYTIRDFSKAKNNWVNFFIDDPGLDIYVDRGSQANYYWEVEEFGDKIYGFYGADINPEHNHANYPGAYVGHCTSFRNEKDGIDTGTGVVFANPADYGEGATFAGELLVKWAFVSQQNYAAYGAKLEAYAAAEALAAKIAEAKEAGVDASAAEAVYANTNSTAAELTAAMVALTQAILDDMAGKATPENPADMSDKIVNRDFAGGDCTTGWGGTAFGRGGTVADGAEMYEKNYDSYQDINGLPAGIYRVGVQSFYRAGTAAGDYQNYIENDMGTRNARLYAFNGDSTEVSVGIVHLASGAEETNKSGADEISCADALLVANTMAAADYHFNTLDKYHNYLLCEVAADGKLRIGARKETLISTDWTLFDNFSLFFYGDSDAAYKMWLDETLANLPAYNFDEVACYAPLKEEYQVIVEAAAKAVTKEEIRASLAAISDKADEFRACVAAYTQYMNKVAALRAEQAEGIEYICDEGYVMVDYIMEDNVMEPYDEMPNGSYDYIIAGGTLTTEQMLAEIAWLDALYQAAVANSLQPGDDCTKALINPNFTYADGRGWQNPNGVTMTGGLSTYPCAEAYEKAFDVYQVVDNLPNGIYKVTANAFYRPAANGSFDGSEAVPAEIYFNEFTAPVQHILADHSETELFNDGSWMTDYMYSDGVYIPNSMNGASTYFLAGKYLQEVYGLVENGSMRLGIRSATSGTSSWCLWTNFKLIYVGKDVDALSEILPVYIEKADLLLANGDYMNASAKRGLENAVATATVAAGATDADAMFDALIALNAALTTANASVSAYADLVAAVEDLSTAIDWYVTASDEARQNALNVLDEVSSKLAEGAYADEEVAAALETVAAAKAGLRVPAIEPTDEAPADFTDWIINPAFDDANANGWTISISDKTNYGYQSASYTGDATISQFVEVWRSENQPLGDGDIFQTISYLPAGTYTLGCDIIANQQDGVTATSGVYLFAEQTDGTIDSLSVATGNGAPEHFEVTFAKTAETTVSIGVRCASATANWLAADNWTLTYYGKQSQKKPTYIDTVSQPAVEPVVIYDLFGRRLSELQPGINIVNGKKILVK